MKYTIAPSLLPAYEIADELNSLLSEHQNVIVTAPPGAGKSTLLPLTMLEGMGSEGRIVVLEPRRIAARQIAMRMADMIGEPVGQTVGYRVRFESCVSAATRIEVLTEGILTRMLVEDPTLEGVSLVVFDEYHERNLHSDVALALVREAQTVIRPDLRVVVMSATIDTVELCQKLRASLVESRGRMFPVTLYHTETDCEPRDCAAVVAHSIIEAHRRHEGDILAFLPGQYDIERCREALGSALGTTHICPLYGQLTPAEQQVAIQPSRAGERKVVLATNIAETSLTIEGVRIVIDSGLCRALCYDSRTDLSHLETLRISLDMATQRSGRAGRVAEGVCYRLWTLATEHRMEPQRMPEILTADLTPMLLDIAAWQGSVSLSIVQQMQWLTPPPKAQVISALKVLQALGALDATDRLTPHGRKLVQLPCHPRMAQMLVTAETPSLQSLACDLAALLEEKDPLAQSAGCDINLRVEALCKARRQHSLRQWERVERTAQQYRKLVRVEADNTTPDPYATGRLLAMAYPERLALQKDATRYRLAGGDTAQLDTSDELSSYCWLAVASLNAGGRMFLASPVEVKDLPELTTEISRLSWNSKQGGVTAQTERRIGQLLIEARPLSDVSREEIVRVICEAARSEGRSMFTFDEQVQNLQQRVAAVAEWHPERTFPDLSTETVLQRAADWLPLYIGRASTAAELRKIDLTEALLSLLDYEQQQTLDRLAPTHLQVPTGSRIRVEYRQGAELPVLRVRLQECFGLTDTPRVDDGRRPVLMELLSPGFKPVQLTQDLRSFWSGTYFEVRKELRRRYPKHHWPDNPLEAEPVRGVKRKG